jgi:D-amino-acid dehydrogenase
VLARRARGGGRVTEREADVVVVGAGAVGVCSAWSLLASGHSVVVVERAERLGLDTAAGSGGLITPSHCFPVAGAKVLRALPQMLLGRDSMASLRLRLDPQLLRFAAHALRRGRRDHLLSGLRALRDQSRTSRALFAQLARAGIDIDLRHSGVMNVCNTDAGLARLLDEARTLEREGFAPRILDGTEASRVEPALRDDVAGAVLWEEDDQCIPARLTPALGAAATDRGARFELGTAVVGFERDAAGAVTRVRTDRGAIRARHVVIAAGAETPRIARALGVHVPIEAGKGHHIDIHAWDEPLAVPMILHEDVLGVTSMGTDLRLVGGMDFVGVDRAIDPRRIQGIYRRVAHYLRRPPEPGRQQTTSWSGLRPCAPDGLPIVGPLRSAPNVLLATGHGMLGLTLAPATGEDVARLVRADRDPLRDAPWLAQYAPSRFGI